MSLRDLRRFAFARGKQGRQGAQKSRARDSGKRRLRLILVSIIAVASIVAWPVARRVRLWTLPRAEAIVRFATSNASDFQRLRRPGPGDWRYHYPDEYQESYEEYVENYANTRAEKKLLAVTPIGPFDLHERDVLAKAAEFVGIWFDKPVRIEEAAPLPAAVEAFRGSSRRQYDARYLVDQIVTIYENYGFDTEIIVASIRNPIHVLDAALMGADIATIPY